VDIGLVVDVCCRLDAGSYSKLHSKSAMNRSSGVCALRLRSSAVEQKFMSRHPPTDLAKMQNSRIESLH